MLYWNKRRIDRLTPFDARLIELRRFAATVTKKAVKRDAGVASEEAFNSATACLKEVMKYQYGLERAYLAASGGTFMQSVLLPGAYGEKFMVSVNPAAYYPHRKTRNRAVTASGATVPQINPEAMLTALDKWENRRSGFDGALIRPYVIAFDPKRAAAMWNNMEPEDRGKSRAEIEFVHNGELFVNRNLVILKTDDNPVLSGEVEEVYDLMEIHHDKMIGMTKNKRGGKMPNSHVVAYLVSCMIVVQDIKTIFRNFIHDYLKERLPTMLRTALAPMHANMSGDWAGYAGPSLYQRRSPLFWQRHIEANEGLLHFTPPHTKIIASAIPHDKMALNMKRKKKKYLNNLRGAEHRDKWLAAQVYFCNWSTNLFLGSNSGVTVPEACQQDYDIPPDYKIKQRQRPDFAKGEAA